MKPNHPNAYEIQKRIKVAFQALHEDGYFTAMKFWCCQSCGRSQIPEEYASKFVFYHEQDHEGLMEHGECHLAWEGDGLEICRRLTEAKLGVNWDHSPSTRIAISLPTNN